jgi:hypothetical protein
MSEDPRSSIVKWWAVLAAGTAGALLVAWLARVAGVQLHTLLIVVTGAVGLAWAILLVSLPWNLYFAARGVTRQLAQSADRGIVIHDRDQAEARRIARRMLWFALGGHVVTALAAGVIGYVTGAAEGYYLAGFYLVSALVRPAFAYFSHLRERIGALSRESTHPRDDVLELRSQVSELRGTVRQLAADLPAQTGKARDDLRRAEANLTSSITHAQQMLSQDLIRIQETQSADRAAALGRDEALGRRVDTMVRQVENALDGIGDHQDLQTGLRALIRMIRTDESA